MITFQVKKYATKIKQSNVDIFTIGNLNSVTSSKYATHEKLSEIVTKSQQ